MLKKQLPYGQGAIIEVDICKGNKKKELWEQIRIPQFRLKAED